MGLLGKTKKIELSNLVECQFKTAKPTEWPVLLQADLTQPATATRYGQQTIASIRRVNTKPD
jgi:hypothetical protein